MLQIGFARKHMPFNFCVQNLELNEFAAICTNRESRPTIRVVAIEYLSI